MRFLPAGDSAVLVEFGDRIDRALSNRVLTLARALRAAPVPGIADVVPTFRSLLVHYDPLLTSGKDVTVAIRTLTALENGRGRPRRRWTVPACYVPELAPDLAEVAERTGLTIEEAVSRHAGTEFHVYMIGFAPGHPYMGDLPGELARQARIPDARVTRAHGSVRFASVAALVSTERACVWTLGGILDDAQFDRLLAAAETELAPFRGADGTVTFDMPALILTAARPAHQG